MPRAFLPRFAITLAACCALGAGLSGCDPAAESIADLLHPPSAAEMAARLQDLSASGQTTEALRKGEEWLKRHPDPQGRVHRALGALYADAGDTLSAVRHLQQAVEAENASPPGSALPPAAASTAVPSEPPPARGPAAPAAPVVEVDGASVREVPGGLEVRAGDAVVTVPR